MAPSTCDAMPFNHWFTWAFQLKAGDELWYRRCEGGNVQALVLETCPQSNSCWVEYYIERPGGGRQHRRALVKLEDLARIQFEQDISSQSEADPNYGASQESVTTSEETSEAISEIYDANARREKAYSMVVEDEASKERRRSRAFSMLFAEERNRAYSMLFADERRRSRAQSMLFAEERRRSRAQSMLFAEERRRSRAQSMLFAEERSRAQSMVCAEERSRAQSMVCAEERNRAYSMLFADPRSSALSMVTEGELSSVPEDSELRYKRAVSMIFSDGSGERQVSEASLPSIIECDVKDSSDDSEEGLKRITEGSEDFRDESSSDARSTAPDSEGAQGAFQPTYGEEISWPSALWTMPQLVGLEPENVEVFCGSSTDSCMNCAKPLAGHSVSKVANEMSELCKILQMRATFLEAEEGGSLDFDGEGLSAQAWVYTPSPEESDKSGEEMDPCKAFGEDQEDEPKSSEDVQEEEVVKEEGASEEAGSAEETEKPKKKVGLVARAWAMLGCQSGMKSEKPPEKTSPEKASGQDVQEAESTGSGQDE
ncbi:unnamed protein product [Durusdinium trenchii]|uniref:Uncharacterized protein n=2 Tax=Durusdinium trenchii TaxID=1381693 RepID=A0ABP0HTT0_9DINO